LHISRLVAAEADNVCTRRLFNTTEYTPVGFPKSGDALSSTTDGRGHDDAAADFVVVGSPAAPAIP
jgi:hypothetical protein